MKFFIVLGRRYKSVFIMQLLFIICGLNLSSATTADYSINEKNMHEAIQTILKEMPSVVGENPPSQRLIDAVDDLEWQMYTLAQHSSEHSIRPPDLSAIPARCAGLKGAPDTDVKEKKKELREYEEKRDLADKVYKKMHVKRFIRYMTAEVDALLSILPTSTGWTMLDLADKVCSAIFSDLSTRDPSGVGAFLSQSDSARNEDVIKQRVASWCNDWERKEPGFCKDKKNAEALSLRVNYEIEQLAAEKKALYEGKVTPLQNEINASREKLRKNQENLKKYHALCGKIKKLQPWTPATAKQPKIKVTKSASATSVNKGDNVSYSYSVSNTGNVPLSKISVSDDKCSPVTFTGGDTNNDGMLDPSEVWLYKCSVVLSADTTNKASVSGEDASGKTVTDTASATVKVKQATVTPTGTCSPPTVKVPDVVNKAEAAAKEELKNNQLAGVVLQRDYSDTVAEGLVMMQDPSGGECIDPNSIVNLWVSRGRKKDEQTNEPQKKFTAEFDCGNAFELAPGDFLGRSCWIIVRGWEGNTERRVVVKIDYNRRSGIEILPGDTWAPPSLMFTPGVSDYNDRYIFSESFRAADSAPQGTTAVTITVSQEGVGSVTFVVNVEVLKKGLLPSSGEGIRPPATVATGSGGEYCVWRYKLFGDPPPCFHFVSAVCTSPRYNNPSNGYELVGTGMKWGEADARVGELSRYFDDAYGCTGLGAGVKDTDGDGVPDDKDECPTDPEKKSKGVCDCLVSDRDSDYDGTPDCIDKCPDDINKTSPGVCGCGTPDKDSDGDGVMDCNDECPSDPDKTKIGECGCFAPDVDSDGDGELDCNDRCPKDPAKKKDEGYCGCGKPETDKDGDAWPDCIDNCPNDPYKTDDPGICGCGNPETDSDSDGVPDCKDKCPNDPDKTEPGTAGCGKPEKTACTKYDPTNPACEPAGSKGDKPPVDPNVGSGFQEGMPGGKPPVKGGPEGGGEQQPGTYTKPPKPEGGEEGETPPQEETPPVCYDPHTGLYGPCPPRKPPIPVLPPKKPEKGGGKPKPPTSPAACPPGCHMRPDGSGCHCPEGGSGDSPPSSTAPPSTAPPPSTTPSTSTPSGGGGG